LLFVLSVINFGILGLSYQLLNSDRLIFIWLSFSMEFSFPASNIQTITNFSLTNVSDCGFVKWSITLF